MKSYFKLLTIIVLYTTLVYACKKSNTTPTPKLTGLEGVWGGRRAGGVDSFSLILKLGDSLTGTFKIGPVATMNNVEVKGTWHIIDTVFVANCIDVKNGGGGGGGVKTLFARVNTDSLTGSWFASGGSTGNFKAKKIK